MWVPVPLYVGPVPLSLQMFSLTIPLPGTSRQRLPSTTMIYIRSLDTNPYKKCARNSKILHKHKNMRTIKVVPVPLSLQMFSLTIALPGTSQQRLPSTAMIYIRSLDTNPYKKCSRNSKNMHKHKNMRTTKGTYSYTK